MADDKTYYYGDFDTSEYLNYTGENQWNAIYTITLGELIENEIFDWADPLVDWSNAAYSAEQYKRVCDYFIERFRFREISIEPYWEWARFLRRRIVYELCPKYNILYARIDEGIDPFQESDEYHKRREVGSEYPETLLSGNADYASDGRDLEYETLKEGNAVDSLNNYVTSWHSVDMMFLDELESLFIGLYSMSLNAM